MAGVEDQAAIIAAQARRITALERASSRQITGLGIADGSIDSQHYVDGSIDPEHLSAAAKKGWQYIADGTGSSVSIPAGAKAVRVGWSCLASGAGSFGVRINNDSTAGLYVHSGSTITPAGSFGTIADGVASNAYLVGSLLASVRQWGEFEIDCSVNTCPIKATAYRQGIPTGSLRYESWGILSSARTVTSLSMFASGTSFTSLAWRAEAFL